LLEFRVFGIFFKNRLAVDELPPDDSSPLCCFWVLKEESPGGMTLTVRRRLRVHLVFWVCMHDLAVMNTRQATRANLAQFGFFCEL